MRDERDNSPFRFGLATLVLVGLVAVSLAGVIAGGGVFCACVAAAGSSLLTLLVTRGRSQADAPVLPDNPNETPCDQVMGEIPATPSPDAEPPAPEPPAAEPDDEGPTTTREALELEEVTTVPPAESEAIAPGLPTGPDAEPRENVSQATALSPTEPTVPVPETSLLDFAALSERLVSSQEPIDELKRFVRDIRRRERSGSKQLPPSELERYAARLLDEAGLFAKDVELPRIAIVRPKPSHMLYLRTSEPRIPYLAKLRIIRIEAALNALRFADASLGTDASMEAAYRLNQGLARSIVAQALPIDQPLELEGALQPDGEWAVRYGISQAIETLQVPYRLVARYRTNVADGNVAIEVDLTPAEAFPSSCFVDGLGIVPTTGDMRQRAVADYALRLGLLLAASAFRCSPRIRHVWVAGIMETATRRTCYYCVDFDRWRFARVDLQDIGDLQETYRSFAPVLRYEDGWLRPVRQTFHLEEERFCPTRRYMPVSLSSRRLEGQVATSLGTDHVSGLAIEEADGRTVVANAIMMRLTPDTDERATQKNVRTVMELAADDPDPTVRTAAERVVRGLIDGSLHSDALSVGEEFVRGDALNRANDRAKELLMQQRPAEAAQAVAPIIDAIDASHCYDDSASVVYRYFNSYVERALYNRLSADDGDRRTVMLVPDAYYEAHLILSVTSMMEGDTDVAEMHARRLIDLAPLDGRSHLHLVKCLEMQGRNDEAIEQLCRMLEMAHEPIGMGLAYYRMAFFQWQRGNISAARACYQCAMHFLPGSTPMMAMELSVLYLQNPDMVEQESSDEQIEQTLADYDIPMAPTEHTSEVFYECAQASLDAEIFPVARNFASILGAFSGDDIIAGLIRSLEDAPDH